MLLDKMFHVKQEEVFQQVFHREFEFPNSIQICNPLNYKELQIYKTWMSEIPELSKGYPQAVKKRLFSYYLIIQINSF